MAKRRSKEGNTLRDKKRRGDEKRVNEKQQVRYKQVPPVQPMNAKQQEYMYSINCNPLTLATGYAGTSKTFIPSCIACDMLKLNQIDKIYLSRPNISDSESLGYFSGDKDEKMTNWLMPILDAMNSRLGAGAVEYHIRKGDIEFIPFEVIKGRSLNDCFVIVDEAEDLTLKEVKKAITRLGKNAKMVLAGDITQSDLDCESGLSLALKFVKEPDSDLDCGWVDFNSVNDIVRSDTVRKWILRFNKYETEGK